MPLSVSNLTGFGGAVPPPITGTFRSAAVPTGGGTTTATYSGVSIGAASAERVVLAAFSEDNTFNTSLNSCTIGGVAATFLQRYYDPDQLIEFYIARVPTGTTADVVFTATSNFKSTTVVGVWTIDGLQTLAAAATQTAIGGTGNNNISLPVTTTNNFVVAVSVTLTNANFTWTNITERYDIIAGISGHSGASSSNNAVGTYSFNDTHSGGTITLAAIFEQ